ncbi:GyrI-like domain-containing protein [Sphingobacterium hotanense]|uniref:Effector binding domain-containing protein n=1 Tax=Sphingobacterium hotanense TaxID=649196 RepID=A0ABT7NKB5_9SPHI|nr:GyrI-like domain-containing protein [Sphingobacterium hotanense]MDM1047657.1 effector binding domain-containing protein [Sphingobacterium hotanense]
MSTETIEQFYVIGISTRTCNANGQAAEDIEALWVKFWNENIQEQIPNKTSEDIYAIYTDYESDFNHPYTTIIGLPVTSLEQIPDGFVGVTIEEAKYEKFVSKGKMPEAVGKTWFKIWANTDLDRAYKADFTVHGKKYYDGDLAEVETFISVMD